MRLKLFTLDDFKKCYRVLLRIIGKKAVDPSEELVPDDSFLSTKKIVEGCGGENFIRQPKMGARQNNSRTAWPLKATTRLEKK